MAIPDKTLCLFHAKLENDAGAYRIEVPDREVSLGTLDPHRSYRVALLPSTAGQTDRRTPRKHSGGSRDAPVGEGEQVEVEIEDYGEQGDGLARIGKGYIVFVPETDIGDRVMVEIGKVTENFAFGEVVEGPY